MNTLGAIVVDEQIFPIVKIELRGGVFLLTAEAHGPMPSFSFRDYVLIGNDSRVIYRCQRKNDTIIPELLFKGDCISICVELSIDNQEAKQGGPVKWSVAR